MARVSYALSLVLAAALASSAIADDWTSFGGGRYCDNCSSCAGLDNCETVFDWLDGCNWGGDDCCGWYGLAEALFWTRNNNTGRVAVIRVTDEGNALPGTTVLTTSDPTFRWQPGVRLLVGWQQDACRAWEFSYFGIFNWQASATAIGNNNLAIPGNLGLASLDFFAADQMTLDYKSRLNNVEANFVRSLSGDVALIAGFRYLTLNEDFNIRSTDLDSGTSNYRIHSTNNLFGGQLGARLKQYYSRFGWDATVKAGVFGNAASQAQTVTDFPPLFFLRDQRTASGGQVAFVGDINISGFYQLNDLWALRGGYNLLWVQGVALAPNQLDFTDTPTSGTTLHSTGGFFAHGVNLGVQASW
jgi:hypothetical protein